MYHRGLGVAQFCSALTPSQNIAVLISDNEIKLFVTNARFRAISVVPFNALEKYDVSVYN